MHVRIYAIKGMPWTESGRVELAKGLVKIGYQVRIGRERPSGKTSGAYVWYVEYDE